MKIAQIVCAFPPYKGGIANVARDFSEILADAGNEITVFTPDYGQPTAEKNNFKITLLKPWLRMGLGVFLPQLFFKLPDFDIIHLNYPFFGAAEVVWLAKTIWPKKFKLIVHFHMDVAGLSPFAKILSLPAEIIRNSLFKKADSITCASLDYIKNSSLAEIYKKYPEKFKEIPFGVDTKKFRPKDFQESPSNSAKILFVGGLDKAHYFKGVDVLLKAISKLFKKNWELLIVGDGDLRKKYENLAKKLNINNRVKFLGKIPDQKLPSIYQQADLFVLPSINKNEAFGLVLLEAMASGLPMIASDLPGVRTVFANGKQGLLAKPGDEEDLKNKMEEILSNEKKRKEMGREARTLATEKYDSEKIKTKLIEVF
ncbi:MAG: glycosyltransferase family 4 protein [Patescibacteria group bacterium]|nr:glycosyltransferase family 4 protein [Patescibacteria group bacterium]